MPEPLRSPAPLPAGDLPTLRLLTGLSQRKHPSHGHVVSGLGATYGTHMAVNMAAGLLFLGGGRMTLTTTPSSIAALLIATYPVWPATPMDNRSHLQVRGAHLVVTHNSNTKPHAPTT